MVSQQQSLTRALTEDGEKPPEAAQYQCDFSHGGDPKTRKLENQAAGWKRMWAGALRGASAHSVHLPRRAGTHQSDSPAALYLHAICMTTRLRSCHAASIPKRVSFAAATFLDPVQGWHGGLACGAVGREGPTWSATLAALFIAQGLA